MYMVNIHGIEHVNLCTSKGTLYNSRLCPLVLRLDKGSNTRNIHANSYLG